jgi:hypothetical protein
VAEQKCLPPAFSCSFLIEFDGFQQLPQVLREAILQNLWDILTGKNEEPAFANIAPESKQAVLEIL